MLQLARLDRADPSQIGVYGNGTDMRSHLHLMVSAGVTGQLGLSSASTVAGLAYKEPTRLERT